MSDPTDQPAAPGSSDTESAPTARSGLDLWDGTGFGPALGGLIVAFLGTWGGASLALSFNGPDLDAYRIIASALPLLMGLTGVVLGWLTLRRHTDGLARAVAAAAIVVGAVTMVVGGIGWWGQESTREDYARGEPTSFDTSGFDSGGFDTAGSGADQRPDCGPTTLAPGNTIVIDEC